MGRGVILLKVAVAAKVVGMKVFNERKDILYVFFYIYAFVFFWLEVVRTFFAIGKAALEYLAFGLLVA
jgi:hypothetical protein